jgi:hypothetical protein
MNIRNKPCACGSGKKSKRCCDSAEAKAKRYATWRTEREAQLAARLEQFEKERAEYQSSEPEKGPFTYRRQPTMNAIALLASAMALPMGRRM